MRYTEVGFKSDAPTLTTPSYCNSPLNNSGEVIGFNGESGEWLSPRYHNLLTNLKPHSDWCITF
jgi:hypothetical protein